MDKYNFFSPIDFRYFVADLAGYLSENAFTKYKLKVELALIKTLVKYKLCPKAVIAEVEKASGEITTEEVYQEEERIHHDIRALVNLIRNRVSNKAKPFIHATATSCDIVDTARVLMFKEAVLAVILKDMIALEKVWIELAKAEKNTLQIGRTHGQQAEPITFGFAIAQYVDRWGNKILKLKALAEDLVGKFSGAVGAYNASSLFIGSPEKFEKDILLNLGLKPARISTQIIPPEQLTDFFHQITSSFGILANFSDDMRHLQRTEIGEVGEPFSKDQVGSSTMPQKRNPINFENVKSAWKEFMPRMLTVYMDQISEHQRDLTNSLSSRFLPELLVMFDSSIRRIIKISRNLVVDKANMERNFLIGADKIIAEPLQILLSFYGHPDAHETVRVLTMESYKTGKKLSEIMSKDTKLKNYVSKFSQDQLQIISDPKKYLGIACKKTIKVCEFWQEKINNL